MSSERTIILGLFLALYGIVVMVNPKWGDWKSINDARLKSIYGEKAYPFLIRFVSGPLLVAIGGFLVWYAITDPS